MAGEGVDSRLSMLTSVIGSFASLTEDEDDFSLLPQDLDFTNDIVGDLIQLLEETLASENETDFEVLVSRLAPIPQKSLVPVENGGGVVVVIAYLFVCCQRELSCDSL